MTAGSKQSTPCKKNGCASGPTKKATDAIEPARAPTKALDQPTELEKAMAAMRAAEEVLNQRHAVIKAQPNIGKKMMPSEAHEKTTKLEDKPRTAHLPAHISTPVYKRKHQFSNVKDAAEALNRRDFATKLAYNAVQGCPSAVMTADRINAHFELQARESESTKTKLLVSANGLVIDVNAFGTVEHNWLARYKTISNNVELLERRLIGSEDYETIASQLFPDYREKIFKPEHFEIFVAGLGEEGILTRSQAKTIARLGVTVEEFDEGACYTGPSKDDDIHKYGAAALSIFDIPAPDRRTATSLTKAPKTTGPDLYPYLRTLVEAAVYDQKIWKGYFFANARSKLTDFYQAHALTEEGWLLPPNLTAYQRPWSHRDLRLLHRGHLLYQLLAQYDTGDITDFGILRAVRATFVHIPAQPFFSPEDLESFLYHRLPGSGLPASQVPHILALHPDHDTAFANPKLRQVIMSGLEERADAFVLEEQQRLKEIEVSFSTFVSATKAQMSAWQRVKAKCKRVFGRKVVVRPFDPYAPEHEA